MYNNLYWVVHTLGYFSLAFLLIPYQYWKKIWITGITGGILYTCLVQFLAVKIFEKWSFMPTSFTLWEIPFFFIINWFSVTLIFCYLILKYIKYKIPIILFFTLLSTLMNYCATYHKAITLINWSLADTFMYALFSHTLIFFILKLQVKELQIIDK